MLLHIKTCHMVVEIHGIGAKTYEQTTRKEQNPEKKKKKNLIHILSVDLREKCNCNFSKERMTFSINGDRTIMYT